MDDVLVYGQTEAEHDAELKKVLMRCREKNLNSKKFKTNEGEYIRLILTENDLQPDLKKVDAVNNFPSSNDNQTKKIVRVVNHLANFVLNMCVINRPVTLNARERHKILMG